MDKESFRHEAEEAERHLDTLRQQTNLPPGQQDLIAQALVGLSGSLQRLQEANAELSRQNEECRASCRRLEEERAYYRDLFDHAPFARLLTTLSGTIQIVNAPATSLLRQAEGSLVGAHLGAFLPEQEQEALGRHLVRLQDAQAVHDWEVRLQPASGDPVWASLSAEPVLGLERRPVAVQWVLRDVSRQAAAELAQLRSERLLRRFIEQYLDGVALTDEQGLLVEWNQAMEQITGLPASEARGRPIWDVQFRLGSEAERTPAAYERLKASLQDLLRGGQAPWLGQVLERGYTRPDGADRILEGVVFPIKSDEGFMLGSVTRDVTGRRQAEDERERLLAQATQERRRAEQLGISLEDERNTFAVVIESTHTQLAYLDPQFNFLLVNSAYTKGSGHTREEMIGRNHFDLFPDAENQAIFERVRDTGMAARFSAKAFEFADQPERGVTYWDWSLVPVRRAAGQIQGLVLSLLDVSEQVRSRLQIEALSAQSQRQADELTAILNAIPESVAVWDVEGKLARANPASAAFGIGPGAVEASVLFREADVRAANGHAMAHRESVVAQALRGQTVLGQQESMSNSQGERREIVADGAPVLSGGQVMAAVVVTRDVTEQRRTERERERLLAENRAQREFLERLVETAPVGIAVLRGPDHRYEVANPYYRAMTGAPDRPIIGCTIVEAIPDLANRRMVEVMDEVYRTGQTVSTREVELSIGPGREQTYWDTDRVPLRRPDGSVDGILVLAREVTRHVQDRRRIEALSAEARRHAAELEAVITALVEPVLVFDADGAIIRANPAAVAALGLDPVGLPELDLGQRMRVCYPDGRPIPADDLVAARALRGELVRDEYQALITADGKKRAIVASAAPIVAAGRVSGAVVAWHDVTDLRETEAARREGEEKLRTLFDLMPIGVSILDQERHVVRQSVALARVLGLSRESILRGDHLERTYLRPDGTALPPEELPSARALREQGLVHDLLGAVQDDGTVRWLDVSAVPVPFEDWKVVVATVDVTERREAEAALRQARDELEVRVQERTAELERANRALVAEVRERKRVEGELRQSEQWLEQRVEERTHELTTLLDISNTVALSLDLQPLLALILERLRDVVEYDGGAAFRLVGGALSPVFHRGEILAGDLLHIGSHLEVVSLGHAVIQGPEPMIVADVQGDPALQEAFRRATGARYAALAPAVRAWMAVPITIKQNVYGVLYMYHSQPGRYAEEQARLALPFGNQAAIAIENARLYEQAQELAAIEERQHLARELHDAVTQTLFSASLAADVLPRLWERDHEAGMRCLSEVHQGTRGALAEMRTLLLELRPSALVETELGALLRQLGEAVTSRARIAVTVEADVEGTFPAQVQVTLYRIAQESLNNVTKHSGARRVTVGLHPPSPRPSPQGGGMATAVALSIMDDGCGFEQREGAAKGLGLRIMRERAQSIGATFQIHSRPGEGTQIVVTWPGDAT